MDQVDDPIDVDFEKTFDTVPINQFVFKSKRPMLRGFLLRWIGAYLINRTFEGRIGTLNDSYEVLCGVPQGFVLGPLPTKEQRK